MQCRFPVLLKNLHLFPGKNKSIIIKCAIVGRETPESVPKGMIILIFGMVTGLSVLASVLLCWGTGAFAGLAWLWMLPAGFLGSFLLLAALAFGFLVLVCALIDPDKPRDEDCPWFRKMILSYIHAVLIVLPVTVRQQGFEKLPKDGRFLMVCNHIDNLDPAFLLHCGSRHAISFVAKREAGSMFLVGKVLPKLLCPLINRENDREALKTILRCISLLKNDTVSVGIFPEGRINPYRKLAHFRPGVFKIAQKANVPIVVCTLQGTNHVLPRVTRLKRAVVDVHLVDVIPADQLQDVNTVQIANRVYEMMAQDLGPENVLTPEEEENT